MEDKSAVISLEEILDSEVDDLWDILFPYASEKKVAKEKAVSVVDNTVKTKPNRYMNFLRM